MENFEIKPDRCGGFMIEPHIDTFSTNKIGGIRIMKEKMTGNFYEDVKIVSEAVSQLHSMLDLLEKECMEKDKGKTATDMFIYINNMKNEVSKAVEQSKRLMRASDIEQYGPLSKYVRSYLV